MISYIGGKSRIGKWIKDYIPYNIETYVEPFGGAFWVFFNLDVEKYTNLNNVIYNDFNPLNTNLLKCVKQHKEFYNVIKNYKSQDRDMFNSFQKEIFDENFKINKDCCFETGVKYAYVLTQIFSGSKPATSNFIDLKGKYRSKFDSFKDKLIKDKWIKYFDKINIFENLDFQELILKYDSNNTYFYCDPPYFKTEKYYSKHDFGYDDHERLANILKNIKGKFSLSYYDFDQLSDWFPKDYYRWESKSFKKSAAAKSGKKQNDGEELLIMNYKK